MLARQFDISAGNLRFGALEWGDVNGPLALLAHGYPDTAWTWRHLGPRLASQGWHVVAPFSRGYAPTDLAPDDNYRISALADDLLALKRELGGDARAVLIGHDWGAVVAWLLAQNHPDAFAAYVAMAVPPTRALLDTLRTPGEFRVSLRQLRMSWYFVYNQLPRSERGLDRVIPYLWRTWSPGYDAHEDLERLFAALGDPARRRAALRYYRNNLQGGIRETLTLKPNAPALYLHGRNDGCIQADLLAPHQELLAPGSEYQVIEGAGHFLHLEQPDAVGASIERWIGAPTAV